MANDDMLTLNTDAARADRRRILRWFRPATKIAGRVEDALALIDASVAGGAWAPGAARKVRAAFGQPSIASLWMRDNELRLRATHLPTHIERDVYFILRYGQLGAAVSMLAARLKRAIEDGIEHEESLAAVLAAAWAFLDDAAPVGVAVAALDRRIAPPAITLLGVSPLLTARLQALRVRLTPPPTLAPGEWREVQTVTEPIKTFFVYHVLWPEGTTFPGGRQAPHTCHACGHGIKDSTNWVPILAQTPDGPIGLWTGRDCARKVFGIKVALPKDAQAAAWVALV